jgi:uncharacterized protein (UPF0332 family)
MKPAKYLKWCARQKKGIRIVRESENLKKAYLKKSHEALRSMQINAKEGIGEWVVATSYYAKYFAIYALLSRIGVKCGIHDCTIALFSSLYADKLPKRLVDDLRQAKDDRVEAQYYTTEISMDMQEMIEKTTDFVLKIEEIIDGLSAQKTADKRRELRALRG